jgi:hypothetical protein
VRERRIKVGFILGFNSLYDWRENKGRLEIYSFWREEVHPLGNRFHSRVLLTFTVHVCVGRWVRLASE